MSNEKFAYMTELNPIINYRFVTPIEVILQRINRTPETPQVPEERHQERTEKG